MRIKVIVGLLLFFLGLEAEEAPSRVDARAAAFYAVQDYEKAFTLYLDTEKESFSEWQKNRLLYNLGTLYLAQGAPEKALDYFKKVDPALLSLKRLSVDLQINIAYAYLEMANQESFLDKRLYLIGMAKKMIKEVAFIPVIDQYESFLKQIQEKELLEETDSNKRLLIQKPLDPKENAFIKGEMEKEGYPQKGELATRFFLYRYVNGLTNHLEDSAVNILENLVSDSRTCLNLSYLYLLMDKKEQSDFFVRLMNQEKRAMIEEAKRFIPAVLKVQEKEFHEKKLCQNSPWKKVVPLFEKGFIAGDEEERFHAWDEALKLLKDPDSQNQTNSFSTEMNETMRELEEMHIEDHPKQPAKGGFDRW